MNDIKNAYTWNRMFMNHDEDHQLSFKSAYVPEGLRCITNDLIIFIKDVIVDSYKEDRTLLIPVYKEMEKCIIKSDTDSYAAAYLYMYDMSDIDYCLAIDYSEDKYMLVLHSIFACLLATCLIGQLRKGKFVIDERDLLNNDVRMLIYSGILEEKVMAPFYKLHNLELNEVFHLFD